MSRYLSRLDIDLNRLARPFSRAVLLNCIATAIPQQYRTGAIEFPEYQVKSQSKNSTLFQLHLPFSAGSGDHQAPHFQLGSNVPDICANLYVDDIFAFTFPEETLKKTTPAHRQLLKFIISQCTKYIFGTVASQGEVSLLANAIKYQYSPHRGPEGKRKYFSFF